MRLMFGMTSLLIALAVAGVLAKKQLGAVVVPQPLSPGGQAEIKPGLGKPALQAQQIEHQIKKSIDAAAQRPRMADQE
jgi:hypothetical protein